MRKNIVTIYLLFLIVLLSSILLPAGTKNDYLSRGDNYYHRFDNRNAVLFYQKAYEADPGSYECMLKLTRSWNDWGEELLFLKKRDEAQKYINKAVNLAAELVKKFPDSAGSYTFQAMCLGNYALFKGGKDKVKLAKQIEGDAKKAIKLNPNKFLPYTILGIYYREIADLSWVEKLFANTFYGKLPSGSYRESIKMFNKSLSIDPNVVSTEYHMAKTYKKMGDIEKEKDCLQKAVELPVTNWRDNYLKPKAKKQLEILMQE